MARPRPADCCGLLITTAGLLTVTAGLSETESWTMSRRGWLMFAAMSVIWGFPYLLIKIAVGGVSAPVLVECRVAVGAALLLPVALRKRQLAVLRPHWRWLAVFAAVEILAPWLLLSEAETRLSSSLSGLLIASVPILVAVIARLTGGHDRLSLTRWAGLLAGLAGVALLAVHGAASGDAVSVVEVLLVAVCYATGPVVASRKLDGLPAIGMTAACLAVAAVLYAPLAAVTWPSALPQAKVFGAIAGLAVLCTAVGFLIFFALISEAGPARASVITYVNPAVAVALGVLVLGEPLTPVMLGAFALILGGSVLATRTGQGPARSLRQEPELAVTGPGPGGGQEPAPERSGALLPAENPAACGPVTALDSPR